MNAIRFLVSSSVRLFSSQIFSNIGVVLITLGTASNSAFLLAAASSLSNLYLGIHNL